MRCLHIRDTRDRRRTGFERSLQCFGSLIGSLLYLRYETLQSLVIVTRDEYAMGSRFKYRR